MVIIHSGQHLTRLHNDAPGDCRGRLLLLLILLLFYMSLKPHEQHVLSPSQRTLRRRGCVHSTSSSSFLPIFSSSSSFILPAALHSHTLHLPLFWRLLLLFHTLSQPAWTALIYPYTQRNTCFVAGGGQAGKQGGKQRSRQAGEQQGGSWSCLCLRQVILFALIRLGAKDTNLEVMSKILCSLSKCIIKMLQCVFNINSR